MTFPLILARLAFCFGVFGYLVTGQSNLPARDCLELLDRGFNTSGVYNITPDEQGAFPVWCDQETSGGGWVVFQKRIDGALQFHRGYWSEYKEGFGDLSREFWLGNEKLHRLSYSRSQELLVQLQDSEGDIAHARYSVFSVDSESQKYKLTVGGYSGSAGDDFGDHNGMKFSSIDQDNDKYSGHCGAGWWFNECSSTLLNGGYNAEKGIFWYRWRQHRLLKKTEMKIRTQKQRPLDQYLSFTGTNAQDFSFLPSVLDFKSLTVSWWMRGPARPSASTVFCLIDIANEEKVLEFSFRDEKNFKLAINSTSGEYNSTKVLADSNWHHLLLRWNVATGQWSVFVDGEAGHIGQVTASTGLSFLSHLTVGQSRSASGAVMDSGFKGDILHFNMWQREFLSQDALDLYENCSIQLGTLVPWTELLQRLHGDVKKVEFVRCQPDATYDWPLAKLYDSHKLRELLTGKVATARIGGNFLHTSLGVVTREKKLFVILENTPLACLGNLDLCENGFSVSFWMNFRVNFISDILGMNRKYQDALREWLSPLVPVSARWFLCYRASDHSRDTQMFHRNCDGNEERGPTVTLVKVGRFIFGGFSDQRWGEAPKDYLPSRTTFLFSLVNPAGLGPVKLDVKQDKFDKALRNVREAGPVFGEGDLYIGNHIDGSAVSFSDLGHAYKLPNESFVLGSEEARTFFAGSYKFVPDNVEVFYYHVDKLALTPPEATASATFEDGDRGPYKARPESLSGWCAFWDDQDQWLAIDLGSEQQIIKIELIKTHGDDKYVSSFTLNYSLNGQVWRSYNQNQIFNLSALVTIPAARHIKIHPVNWNSEICMRVRIYKLVNIDRGVGNELLIPNHNFKASSWACMSPASFFKGIPDGKCHSAWCGPAPDSSNWLQIKVASHLKIISHLASKGSNKGHMVTSFYLAYGTDGIVWENYTVEGERQLFYSGSDAKEWIGHHILKPFWALYLRIIPHECTSICCMAVKVYHHFHAQERYRSNFIISSGGLNQEGFNLYHSFNVMANTSSYSLTLGTTSKRWSLEMQRNPIIPFGWVHVCITWSEAWGLRYYENGRLVEKQLTYERVATAHTTDQVKIGRNALVGIVFTQFHLQVSELMFWYSVLTEARVKETLRLTDVNRIWLPDNEQPVMDLKWQQRTNCTPTNDTGPCRGRTKTFMYIESSYPSAKGHKARLISRVTVPVRNCFSFWYFMYGNTTGRLNVYLVAKSFSSLEEKLIWRVVGPRGNEWKKAEISIDINYAYQIIMEGVIGGYHGDIAISDASLAISDNCSFAPDEAKQNACGIQSGMIDHIASYILPFHEWLAQAGCSTSRWVPCYRAIEHGWSSRAFHEGCQQDGPSVVLVRKKSFIFGGFSDTSWNFEGCDNGSALGMQSGAIPDSHITASSQHSDGFAAPRSRLYILRTGSLYAAWIPSAHDQDQWLQIDIGELLCVVTAVATQGRGDYPLWVTSYKLQYSDKNTTDFQFYTEQGSTDSKIFPGNTDQNTVICHKLNPPIKGRYIRFRPWTWNGKIAMRVELYSFRGSSSIVKPSSKAFLFSLRSFFENHNSTRLDIKPLHRHRAVTVDYDMLKFGDGDLTVNLNNQSVEADIGNVYQAPSVSEPSTFFAGEEEFQADDVEVLIPTDSVCEPPCFHGQYCDEITGQNICNSTLRDEEWCRESLRFLPRALGMESGAIADEQISASTEYNLFHAAKYGRLHLKRKPGNAGGWSSLTLDTNQWLQIDLANDRTGVNRVATQGRNDYNQFVTKYQLQYSEDGVTFHYYSEQGQGQAKTFDGNFDRDTVVSHDLNPPLTARFFRFRPLHWVSHISMRVELYGPGRVIQETDHFTKTAAFYWTMDNHQDIKNLVGNDWGRSVNGTVTIAGIKGNAVYIKAGASGRFTLSAGLPTSCLFDPSLCSNGFTLMLWLWFKHTAQGKVLLASHGGAMRGFQMIQMASSTPQVAFFITSDNKMCSCSFSTPKEIWTHYVLTYRSLTDASDIRVFLQGEEVVDFVDKYCKDGIAATEQLLTQFTIGPQEDENQENLPEAAFDEIIVWHKNLPREVISTFFNYYKGSPNLQIRTNVSVADIKWKESLLDPESAEFMSKTDTLLNEIKAVTNGDVEVIVHRYWPKYNAGGPLMTSLGCDFTVKFAQTGYQAAESFVKWLESGGRQIHHIEANDIYVTAVSLQAANQSQETTINVTIAWPGPAQLTHGIFQGYQIFYRDTRRGHDFNVTLRENVSFYEIQHLHPYTEYEISARCLTLEGDGRTSQSIFIWTAASAPSFPPTSITVSNLSSTSLRVTWTKIPTSLVQGKIKGYAVLFFAVRDGRNNIENVTLNNGNVNETILVDLKKYTNYSVQVLGFTEEDKIGPQSTPVYAMTDQDVPVLPPSDVIAQGTGTSTILLLWGPVPEHGVLGIIVDYDVAYTKLNDTTGPKKAACSTSFRCELKNLDFGTRYTIFVSGVTSKGVGANASVEAVTFKAVPGPPTGVHGYNTSSTSIAISWNLIPSDARYEPVVAYEVTIVNTNNSTGKPLALKIMKSVCSNNGSMSLQRTQLEKFTPYTITIAVVTRKGLTNTTERITVFTDEDIPEGIPQNITPVASSATSVTLAWKPPSLEESNGVIVGYLIILYDKLWNTTRNITVTSLDEAIIEDLFPYTEYEARLVPFNSKGIANVSDVISVRTKEAAPSRPPSNVSSEAPSPSSLRLSWKPVDKQHLNGILRAYVITYFETKSPDDSRQNITIPVTSGRKRRAISNPSSPSFELDGLKAFTDYTVQVMAYTVDYGVPSLQLNVTTAQDVPSHPPINIIAYNTSSTSINVTWLPVPANHMNGIILGYRVLYRREDKPLAGFDNVTLNSSSFHVEITDLEFFTKYEIRLFGFTIAGDGSMSESLFCVTDESVPESAPPSFEVLTANITALEVSWLPVTEEDRNGIILGYLVTLTTTTGDVLSNVTVPGGETLSTIFGGLEIWTNYSAQICAFNSKGYGPWSAVVVGNTDEEAPSVPPTNVTAFNTSSTSIRVAWQPVSTVGLPGILRGYRVYFIEKETYFTRSLKNVTVNSITLETELYQIELPST
ncbi:uncharacterized protein LOC141885641 [Acropora palmata]|uniref:uncharacterized protein LOC141885641 n=1 Tax=Acropora palmata TaxID=6131 RepID=UPI003DA0B4DB